MNVLDKAQLNFLFLSTLGH